MKLNRIGLDLAKQVFQVHGVDSHEQVKCRKQLKRQQMLDFFRQLEPCLVVMEACGRRQRPLLGARVACAGARGAPDCPAVRQTLCEEWQKRRQ